MGSIICNRKTIFNYNSTDRDYLITSCDSMGIKYMLDNENIVLFPALVDKTLILKALTPQEELKALLKPIEDALKNEGAAVIVDEGFTDKASLEYLDAQILIAFSFAEKQSDLTVYLPFEIQKTSIVVTKHLIKQLSFLETRTTYKIADTWNKIRATKYWSYLFGNTTPSIIFEISLPSVKENFLNRFGEMLVKSIIEEIGYKPTEEEQRNYLYFLNDFNQKTHAKDAVTKEQQEIELLISKFKDYQNELDELKRYYFEIEKKELEESDNSKSDETEKAVELEQEEEQNEAVTAKKSNARNKNHKSKKIYLPMTSRKETTQTYLYKLPYPLSYPGDGPQHQFKRPAYNSESVETPPSLTPKDIWKLHGSFHQNYESQGSKKKKSEKKNISHKNPEAEKKLNKIFKTLYP